MTLEQIRENMHHDFQRIGMTEQQAKRAAEGRNGPPRLTSPTRFAQARRDTEASRTPTKVELPSKHEISEDLARRTSALLRQVRVALGHALLHGDRALDRGHGADEFDQNTVTRAADDAATELLDHRCPKFAPVGFHGCQGAFFVRTHQTGIADYVGRHDGGQSALSTFGHGPSVALPE